MVKLLRTPLVRHIGSRSVVSSFDYLSLYFDYIIFLCVLQIRVVGEIEDAVYTVINGHILSSRILNSCGKHATKFYIVH